VSVETDPAADPEAGVPAEEEEAGVPAEEEEATEPAPEFSEGIVVTDPEVEEAFGAAELPAEEYDATVDSPQASSALDMEYSSSSSTDDDVPATA
jgi:hypothetical protein